MFLSIKNRDVIVNLGAMALGNAFSNPHHISDFLLLQFHIRIKHTKVTLLHEGELVQMHLKQDKNIIYMTQCVCVCVCVCVACVTRSRNTNQPTKLSIHVHSTYVYKHL